MANKKAGYGKPRAKKSYNPKFTDSYTFKYYGKQDEDRICITEECNTKLSIYNKFDLCNPCREKGIREVMDSRHHNRAMDSVTEFERQHKVQPIDQFSVDRYLPPSMGISKPDRGEK